jgi:hypothetical protein
MSESLLCSESPAVVTAFAQLAATLNLLEQDVVVLQRTSPLHRSANRKLVRSHVLRSDWLVKPRGFMAASIGASVSDTIVHLIPTGEVECNAVRTLVPPNRAS